jgi:hypothetical protein
VADRQANLAFIRRIIPFIIAVGVVCWPLGLFTLTHVLINSTLLALVWILCVVQARRRPGDPRP